MFLTKEELIELTHKHRRAAQCAVLNAMGIRHKVRPDGSVLVLRTYVEKELGDGQPAEKAKKEKEPNWGALGHA